MAPTAITDMRDPATLGTRTGQRATAMLAGMTGCLCSSCSRCPSRTWIA
jgi:hypothetical protein